MIGVFVSEYVLKNYSKLLLFSVFAYVWSKPTQKPTVLHRVSIFLHLLRIDLVNQFIDHVNCRFTIVCTFCLHNGRNVMGGVAL